MSSESSLTSELSEEDSFDAKPLSFKASPKAIHSSRRFPVMPNSGRKSISPQMLDVMRSRDSSTNRNAQSVNLKLKNLRKSIGSEKDGGNLKFAGSNAGTSRR